MELERRTLQLEDGEVAPPGWHNAPGMSWDDYRYLLAVHESGGVAGAARALGVDKATVRRRVEALEEELGHPLVERKVSGWQMNDAGQRAVAMAARMNDLVEDFVDQQAEKSIATTGSTREALKPVLELVLRRCFETLRSSSTSW